MKVILQCVVALVIANVGWASKSSNQFECVLAAEFYPLEYTIVTRSVSARIRFSSNCMRLRDLTFEAFFSFSRRIQRKLHPTTMNLQIFKNKYRIQYNQKSVLEANSIMQRYQYGQATIEPAQSSPSILVDILRENKVILVEKIPNSYNIGNLRKMLRRANPRFCKIDKSLKSIQCKM